MLLMLALPGSAYIYQGDELGLPEAIDLPATVRQDPTCFRTAGAFLGRDGARVPIPWEAEAPAFGFSPSGASWLPQPPEWARLARDRQEAEPASTVHLVRAALEARRKYGLGHGDLHWLPSPEGVLAFRNDGVMVIANASDVVASLPSGRVLAASGPLAGGADAPDLPPDTTVWLEG